MVKDHGSFVISLDFELFWGVRDVRTVEEYGTNVIGARAVIPLLIDIFEKYGIRATFAIVGLLFCCSREDIKKYSPEVKPNYKNKKLSPYEFNYLDELDNISNPYHFASELIEQLKKSPNIEIGSHTFSHYYCWEEGQSIEEFEEDIVAAVKIAAENGIKIESIVFPRNQIVDEYLQICVKHGITHYRGNPPFFFHINSSYKDKILRLLDTYINISGDTTYDYEEIKEDKDLFNIKASRFLRPFSSRLVLLEDLKIRRIKNEMTSAAKLNRIYHLWWHPHNFGINQEQNLMMLETILNHFIFLRDKYGFKSQSMNDIII